MLPGSDCQVVKKAAAPVYRMRRRLKKVKSGLGTRNEAWNVEELIPYGRKLRMAEHNHVTTELPDYCTLTRPECVAHAV